MTHEQAYPRLVELIELRAAGEDDGALAAHVRTCPRCARRLAELRRIDRALGRAAAGEPAPDELAARVAAIPRLHPQAPPSRPRIGTLGATLAAAAVAAALVVALALSLAPRSEAPSAGGSFVPERTVVLDSPGQAVNARIELGRPAGTSMPLRLSVGGLAPDGRSYELWLRGTAGEVLIEEFRPDHDGRCVVVTIAPMGEWSAAVIRHSDRAGASPATIAVGAL